MKNRKLPVLIHILFWLAFIIPPLVMSPPPEGRGRIDPGGNPYFFGGSTLSLIGLFYLNFYYLIPRYKLQRKGQQYFVAVTLVVIGELVFQYFLKVIFVQDFEAFVLNRELVFPALPMLILVLTLSYALRISEEWRETERAKNELEKEMSSAEVTYLKTQINPHFFFNMLNGIYALAITRSELTPKAIIQLSEMMRYVLYESEKKTVALDKEVSYIRSYIDVQQLRLSTNNQVKLEVRGTTSGIQVLPLLFIPFIENALKFGVSMDDTTLTDVSILVNQNSISFFCQNTIVTKGRVQECSGIGVQNARRRLELMYRDRYKLDLGAYGNNFIVQLTLQLD